MATLLWSALAATGESLPSSDAASLAACQDTIRTAALKLDSETRRAVSACLTAGVECVVGPTHARAACCGQAAARCRSGLGGLGEVKQRFETSVQSRSCGAVSFADFVSPSGLGYGSLGDACAALTPPAPVGDLAALTNCLARLIVARTVCQIGTRGLPRSTDALACVDLEEEFRAATGADLRTCNLGAAPALCKDGKKVIVVSLAEPYAAAVVNLTYPAAVNIPGTGAVDERVQFDADALITTVNDHDQGGDGVDDTLTASLVNFAANPAGPFVTVTFDCSGDTAPALGEFACVVESASDEQGMDITPQVGCALATP